MDAINASMRVRHTGIERHALADSTARLMPLSDGRRANRRMHFIGTYPAYSFSAISAMVGPYGYR